MFEGALRELLGGARVGAALECFNERYAELASDLSGELEEIGYGRQFNPRELADMWTANNDARAYAILGDPAVRLPLAPAGEPARRVPLPAIEVRSHSAEAAAEFTLSDAAPATSDDSQPAVEILRDALEQAVRSLDDLAVRTFVTADLKAAATAGREQLPALAELRIVTRIGASGDVDTLVPGDGKGLDAELVKLHLELAKQAQAQRGELLRALLTALRAGSAG
ncbi:hypothetical protein [Nannocystis pusilla]|uniref:hypothetical protein n=1 Tax=Nannocystis pusilla TaxID=889268 RepID=UPI003B825752